MIEVSVWFCVFMWTGMAVLALTSVYLFKYAKEISNEVDRLAVQESHDSEDLDKALGLLSDHHDKIEGLYESIDGLTVDVQNAKCTIDAFDACERKYGK